MRRLWIFAFIGILLFWLLLRFVVTLKWGNKYFSFKQNLDLSQSSSKIYVANEWDGTISVIDPLDREVIKTIDLSQQYYGKYLRYAPHNVQVSPNGDIVIVSANIFSQDWDHTKNVNNDQLIFINPTIDEISSRMDIAIDAHLAHVVIHPTKPLAYVVGWEKSVLYEVDINQNIISQTITLPKDAWPHGIRLSPDGAFLYIAFIEGKSLAIIDTISYDMKIIAVPGKAVQVAVTSDDKYVFVSLYDTKSIVRYDLLTKNIETLDLPDDSYWPVQLYPTPDNAYIYIADQWYYFDQPVGNRIYKINVEKFAIEQSYSWHSGPHGVVVSLDGAYAYITNIVDNTVSVIDVLQDAIVDTIVVGTMPNGVSMRTKEQGGTP